MFIIFQAHPNYFILSFNKNHLVISPSKKANIQLQEKNTPFRTHLYIHINTHSHTKTKHTHTLMNHLKFQCFICMIFHLVIRLAECKTLFYLRLLSKRNEFL